MAARRKEPSDPIQLWREWVDRSERQLNTMLNEVMSSSAYSQVSGRMMESMLALQTTLNQATERYFTTLNLPTRTDVLTLAERLTAIEERLAAIEAAVSSSKATSRAAAARPPRTRKARTAKSSKPPAKKRAKKKTAKKKTAKKKTTRKTASPRRKVAKKRS